MKATGIVRKLDELGRITLPIELRRNLEVEDRDPLEIYTDDGAIILRPYMERCKQCGAEENLIHAGNGKIVICRTCAEEVKTALED